MNEFYTHLYFDQFLVSIDGCRGGLFNYLGAFWAVNHNCCPSVFALSQP